MADSQPIKKYWKEILQLVKEITGKVIPDDPWTCLFHGIKGSVKQYRESLVPYLLNAAKSLIPKRWQEEESPKMRDCVIAIEGTYNMERLRFSGEEEREGSMDKWGCWQEFKKTWRYVEVMTRSD